MNKYHQILEKILKKGKVQENKKGSIKYLLDQQLKPPLKSITLNLCNVHIYENNIKGTKQQLQGEKVKFE
ncbi:hypothetical protein [Riemerella columbipharyngis]|uniref:Thymidylate synthase n=1 Tax=Riemerella columbipharyngis TaxID=1071918 RepID=A0A1G7DWU2_9FLAO|nr:hypothetical protein [Riemerella columbipharyngis]SDE55690.1 hypothetical protein SAMN05421544_1131 [Riemerella columbipharyngis]